MSSPTSTARATPSHPSARHSDAPVSPDSSAVSAWMDGELPHAPGVTVSDLLESEAAQETWHRYHLIGDALRATAATPLACSESALSASQSRAQFARIIALARQPEVGMAPVTTLPGLPAQGGMGLDKPPLNMGRPVVANDAVYRWKMVAGLASLAAVLGVTWGLSGSGAPQGGVELAQRTVPGAVVQVAASNPASTPLATSTSDPVAGVWVSTPRGDVLRDPRLEAFMQAHQQAGGASALQVPAGFLRNATFRAEQR